MNQFEPFDESTHEERLKRIKSLASSKQYLDEGPVALYHVLWESRAKGHHAIVEWAIKELERLYNLNDSY